MKENDVVIERSTRDRFKVIEVRHKDSLVVIKREYQNTAARMLTYTQLNNDFYITLPEVK